MLHTVDRELMAWDSEVQSHTKRAPLVLVLLQKLHVDPTRHDAPEVAI